MNLIFLLLSTRQFLTKDQIRSSIADYRESSDVAFNRMFERDKEEIRELGIPVETGSHDAVFSDEVGYRIPREAAELPPLDLTPEESAVIGVAAQVWEHAGLAAASAGALVKLKAAGVDVDAAAMQMSEPRLTATEPTFEAAWEAATRRIEVTFAYAKPGAASSQRRVQPWGVLYWRDRWYLGGFDLDRQQPRIFRLGRIEGDIVPVGEPGGYSIPNGTSMRDLARDMLPREPDRSAVLQVAAGRAQTLRRRATATRPLTDSVDEVVVGFHSTRSFAAEIAAHGPNVVVTDPDDLRDAVIAHLRGILT